MQQVQLFLLTVTLIFVAYLEISRLIASDCTLSAFLADEYRLKIVMLLCSGNPLKLKNS